MYENRLVLVTLFLLSAAFGQSQELEIIDVSLTRPQGFPTDGSAILMGDHEEKPHFFWVDEGRIKVAKVDANGVFTSVELPGLTQASSILKSAPRSYWANAVFFWAQDESEQTLWAVRDRGAGFKASRLHSRTKSPGGYLPAFWVKPIGRSGWLIFSELNGVLEVIYWSFSGEKQMLGAVEGIGAPIDDVELFERPDLDSRRADLVIRHRSNEQQVFHWATISDLVIQTPQVLTTIGIEDSSRVAVSYEPTGTDRTFFFSQGSRLVGVPVTGGSASTPWVREFPSKIEVGLYALPQKPGALVVKDVSGIDFWWVPTVPTIKPSSHFQRGIRPSPSASIPLVADTAGNWGFLTLGPSGTPADWVWKILSPGQETTEKPVKGLFGDQLTWNEESLSSSAVVPWVLEKPSDTEAGDNGWILSPLGAFPVTSCWCNLPNDVQRIGDSIMPHSPTPGFIWSGRLLQATGEIPFRSGLSWGLPNLAIIASGE